MKGTLLTVVLLAVSVSHAQWEPTQQLTFSPPGYTSGVSGGERRNLIITGDTLEVVYNEGDTVSGLLDDALFYLRSTDAGVTWQSPSQITERGNNQGWMSIVRAGSCVHVGWLELAGPDSVELFHSRSADNGVSWSTPARLSPSSTPRPTDPSAAAHGSTVHVVYATVHIWETTITYLRSRDDGITWDGPVLLDYRPLPGDNSGCPTICVSGDTVHAFWTVFKLDSTGYSHRIVYCRRSTDNGTTWGPLQRISRDLVGSSTHTSSAVQGTAVIAVWDEINDNGFQVMFSRSLDAGQSWSMPVQVSRHIVAKSVTPTAAMLDTMVHVAWVARLDASRAIGYAYSTDIGETWTATRMLSDSAAGENHLDPTLQSTSAGVHIVWAGGGLHHWEVYYRRNPTANLGVAAETNAELLFPGFPTVMRASELARVEGRILDVQGRDVTDQRRSLSPGVYFLRQASGVGRQASTKIVLTR